MIIDLLKFIGSYAVDAESAFTIRGINNWYTARLDNKSKWHLGNEFGGDTELSVEELARTFETEGYFNKESVTADLTRVILYNVCWANTIVKRTKELLGDNIVEESFRENEVFFKSILEVIDEILDRKEGKKPKLTIVKD